MKSFTGRHDFAKLILKCFVIGASLICALSCAIMLGMPITWSMGLFLLAMLVMLVVSIASMAQGHALITLLREAYVGEGRSFSPSCGVIGYDLSTQHSIDELLEHLILAYAISSTNTTPQEPPADFKALYKITTTHFAYVTDEPNQVSPFKGKTPMSADDVTVVEWFGTVESLETGHALPFASIDELEDLLLTLGRL